MSVRPVISGGDIVALGHVRDVGARDAGLRCGGIGLRSRLLASRCAPRRPRLKSARRAKGVSAIHGHTQSPRVLGSWTSGVQDPSFDALAMAEALCQIDAPVFGIEQEGRRALGMGGVATLGGGEGEYPLLAYAPPCSPGSLGDPSFCRDQGIAYPYLAGSMANGISSEDLVIALGRAGMLGFFGSAGLTVSRVEEALDRISRELGGAPFGVNLIHSPNEPALEDALVDLFLERGLRLVEASAFLRITPAVVRYRVHGIHRGETGAAVAPNGIIAKVSRVELASKFFAPPPEKLLQGLVEAGAVTVSEAELAREIPLAQDVTVEADSGGHTDNRPAMAVFPTLCAVRDRLQEEYGYAQTLRLGLAGGIGTPASACAAFAMGAAYVMTGSINQACVESGTSDTVRAMLAETRQADVAMAPAADMFEMGVKVQVLKRGTMFSMRAAKLYEWYRSCSGLDDIPPAEREKLERTFFQATFEEVWADTKAFFLERDPRQVERAEKDPKHKMALLFRWYLGQASGWANRGERNRKIDYQVWCGPAMGAFNEWVKGSHLEPAENREAVNVALNILYGAVVLTRANALRTQGFELPAEAFRVAPLEAGRLEDALKGRASAVESAR